MAYDHTVRCRCIGLFAAVLAATACGAKSNVGDRDFGTTSVVSGTDERCNQSDDDLDGLVDETFRDDQGRYVNVAHCGACGQPCAPLAGSDTAACITVDGLPTCGAAQCAEGFRITTRGTCETVDRFLCLPCKVNSDCGTLPGATCTDIAGETRCTVQCDGDCPVGYDCEDDQCMPAGGSCSCNPGDNFTVACAAPGITPACVGTQTCLNGVLTDCAFAEDKCDALDNDCDGTVDEGFTDDFGAYTMSEMHCGACGVDCTLSTLPGGTISCGGDPLAPTCGVLCDDVSDGVDVGDTQDANRQLVDGCECTVTSLADDPGPVGATDNTLDVNCDGADGVITESFYVAPDGNDSNPGSPTRPLASVNTAVTRAKDSIGGPTPRPHVFVAAGTYAETVTLPDGIQLHGGYRNDFRALDPGGFVTEIRAPADADTPNGAALFASGIGQTATLVEGITFVGRDGTAASPASVGALFLNATELLTMRNCIVRAGLGAPGIPGQNGAAGASPDTAAQNGQEPRAAVENAQRQCIVGSNNTVNGGAGGTNDCPGVTDPDGGDGGSPGCPVFARQQPPGQDGTQGGAGGRGGQDSAGPITNGPSCAQAVCCGLSDLSVPTNFLQPTDGAPGQDGSPGIPGEGCMNPAGAFDENGLWTGGTATPGLAGTTGRGGGGGGAGGGTQMTWVDGVCQFPDGLGGGGGGGGAGGCGGRGATQGTSGGPSIAVVLARVSGGGVGTLPTLVGNTLVPGTGGRGGNGGAGGAGGLGGAGGAGGELPLADQVTPTLAGPFPGGRGGKGGDGGNGGAGGAGCGGSSIGFLITQIQGSSLSWDPAARQSIRSTARIAPARPKVTATMWGEHNRILPGAAGPGGTAPGNYGRNTFSHGARGFSIGAHIQ